MTGDELVDLVDDQDKVVGSASVRRCLREGLLHRAVATLVVRTSGKFVLQQRSKLDRWNPGLWTISSTGHVKRGETYEAAARRELREELGVEARLKRLRKYALPIFSEGGLTEHEWVSFFTCKTDAPCSIDLAELESVKEVTMEELREALSGGRFTPDAKIILADYLERRS